jgi:DNA-binding NtrC family response regulator
MSVAGHFGFTDGVMTRNEIAPNIGHYSVVVVENESIVWNSQELESYDLLITGHESSPASGMARLQRIHAAGLHLPIILGQAVMLPERPERTLQMIVEATLIKPYTLGEFLEVVNDILHAPADEFPENPLPDWQSPPSAEAVLHRTAGERGSMAVAAAGS